MKVRNKYLNKEAFDMSTYELIKSGHMDQEGQLESLLSRLDHLTSVVAALIDHGKFSNEEILKITESNFIFEACD